MTGSPPDLHENWVHLGLGATAEIQPPFNGVQWYADYSAHYASDGAEGRLVSMYRFADSWDMWEMHPAGSEMVLCTSGAITLIQDIAGKHVATELLPGQYAINPPGVWHTADVADEAEAVFITAGEGTEHRPR